MEEIVDATKKFVDIMVEEQVYEDDFNIERIVNEYSTIKSVLINNSFPVDIAILRSGAQYNVGSHSRNQLYMRRLFDKKIFLALLQELEQTRKVQSVKKQMYLFHRPYFGKPARLNDWRKQVNHRSTQTLKFMNLARTLRII